MKIRILLLVFCILLMPYKITAEETQYKIVDYDTNQMIKDFKDEKKAYEFYEDNVDKYQNLVLLKNNQVIKMEYGIVHFKKDKQCSKTINFYDGNKSGSFNTCQLSDALYVSFDDQDITYQINNIKSSTSFKNVELVPYKGVVRPSVYTVENGKMYHSIMMQSQIDNYSYRLYLGASDLKDGQYYSFDGHYFYDDFYKLSDDVRNKKHKNAINKEKYYNYYMYLPLRTMSNYSADDFKYYIEDVLTYEGKLTSYYDLNNDGANDIINKSQLYDTQNAFIEYQNVYGVNALILMGIAKSESSYGKNFAAYRLNSLYSKLAFDNDEARSNNRYLKVEDSIYAFARYLISNRLSNPKTDVYEGAFIGDNKSGISVHYSHDPYFNEKVVSSIYEIDEKLENKDLNTYAYGITVKDDLTFYKDEALKEEKFTLYNNQELSLTLLKETKKTYKVQIDSSGDDEDRYNFEKRIAYIDKADIKKVINPNAIHENKYYHVTYQASKSSKTITFKENVKASVIPFSFDKKSYLKTDSEVALNKDGKYKLEYRDIDKIEVISPIDNRLELGQVVDLTAYSLKISYKDGTSVKEAITTDMIQKVNPNKKGEQVIKLKYNGLETEFKLVFDEELAKNRQFISENLPNLVKTYQKDGQYDISLVNDIVSKLKMINYDLSMEEIRVLDEILLTNYYRNDINFKIEDTPYDAKISGMGLTIDFKDTANKNNIIKDTYRFDTKGFNLSDNHSLSKIGKGHGMTIEDGVKLSFYRNYEAIDTKIPFIVSLKLKDMDPTKVYVVYHQDQRGNIIKCLATQSESYLTFRAIGDGIYGIYSMDSLNEYQNSDYFENLDSDNDDGFFLEEMVDFSITNFIIIVDEILIVSYLVLYNGKERRWNDYKKSLQSAVYVQEEKPKN